MLQDSALTKMFRINLQNFLLPKRVGLTKYQGSQQKLDLGNTGYGKYFNNISKVVSTMNDLEQIDLQNNSLVGKQAEQIIKDVHFGIKKLDLTGNNIGNGSCQLIAKQFCNFNSKLLDLNLENNNLGDESTTLIIDALIENSTLKILNLSSNLLTDQITFKINRLLTENNCLKEFYLHWNRITRVGGNAIFTALADNQCLKVFDISQNSLGGSSRVKTNVILQALGEFFSKNSTLVHLDLSWNRFSFKESTEIAEFLKTNKSVVGFHFDGNFGFVDCFGFLQVEQEEKDQNNFQMRIRSQLRFYYHF